MTPANGDLHLLRAQTGEPEGQPMKLGAGTVTLGIAVGAFEEAVQYTKERKQFGRPIAEFQGLQWMVADMSIALDAARLMIHRAAHLPVANRANWLPSVMWVMRLCLQSLAARQSFTHASRRRCAWRQVATNP